MNAAAADCGSVVSQDSLRAEFGESVAANLAMAMRFAPQEAEIYRVVLVDYLRFCRQYIAASGVDDDGSNDIGYIMNRVSHETLDHAPMAGE